MNFDFDEDEEKVIQSITSRLNGHDVSLNLIQTGITGTLLQGSPSKIGRLNGVFLSVTLFPLFHPKTKPTIVFTITRKKDCLWVFSLRCDWAEIWEFQFWEKPLSRRCFFLPVVRWFLVLNFDQNYYKPQPRPTIGSKGSEGFWELRNPIG